MVRTVLLVFVCFFFSACALPTDTTAPELTAEAQKILRETGRTEFNALAMRLLERAVEEDPDYLPARQERLNLLLLQQNIGAAVNEADEIVRIRDIPETRLSYCMLRELENSDFSARNSCYEKVASAIAARSDMPHADLNYVLALRLSESQAFQSAAEKHTHQLERPEVRSIVEGLLFDKTRSELIKSYFPPQ